MALFFVQKTSNGKQVTIPNLNYSSYRTVKKHSTPISYLCTKQMASQETLPTSKYKRIVIIGGGFGGIQLARSLQNAPYQVILIDKNDSHQFQPLLYQVATAGLDWKLISFSYSSIFKKNKNVLFRQANVDEILPEQNIINTSIGTIDFDYLVFANGGRNKYRNKESLQEIVYSLKSVNEALRLRNHIIKFFNDEENNLAQKDLKMNLVVIGGGPTGVEVIGALSEMCNFILRKCMTEYSTKQIQLYLIESSDRILPMFDEKSSVKAKYTLEKLGIIVRTKTHIEKIDNEGITLKGGETIITNTVVCASGIQGNAIKGFAAASQTGDHRFRVNEFNMLEGYNNIFAIGDIAFRIEKHHLKGYPQVAQVAIQQAKCLATNFKNQTLNKPLKPFIYIDLGNMVTLGRIKAVVEIGHFKIYGIPAWFIWAFMHLISLVGIKNNLAVLIRWVRSYFNYHSHLKTIIKKNRQF